MKILSVLLLAAALALGAVGSAAAYRHQSVPDATPPVVAVQHHKPVAQAILRGTRFVWAPCPKQTTLEKGACVTDVVRTVVVPAPPVVVPAPVAVAAPAAPAVLAAPAPAPAAAEPGDQNGDRGEHEGDGEHEGGGAHGGDGEHEGDDD